MTKSIFSWRKLFVFVLFLFIRSYSFAASDTLRILFIGNSYTQVNDLPSLIKQIAQSNGKVILTQQDTPGGCTLEKHWQSNVPQQLIKEGNWNYMVLQEFSQRPSMPIEEVKQLVFPYARKLDSLFKAFNPEGETIFYMTWGRENGDSLRCKEWPPVCSYEGMDSLTSERYIMMAEQNNARISPVGTVWRYLRENNPEIELYNKDGSHPSLSGSYAAALCFYTIIFEENPMHISFNASLKPHVVKAIKEAVRKIVYDNLSHWDIGRFTAASSD